MQPKMSVPSIELPGNICKVIAHQARGLVAKGKEDCNNAFVTFNLGKTKFATSVLEKTQQPVWNEECEFFISDYGGTLELVVCHADLLRERFLGRVEISLSAVAASHTQASRKWYKLQPKKGKEAKKLSDRGQLEVTVQLLYRNKVEPSQVRGQEKKSKLNILPSPVDWRRRSSGGSPDARRGVSPSQEDFLNEINSEMQYHEAQPTEAAFYSDDSQSIASSVSDDPRDGRTLHYQQQHRRPSDIVDQEGERKTSGPTTPTQQKRPPVSSSNRFRPGGLQGSARGKGGVARNVKAAFGNISKALSRENMDKVGVSTPDLRQISASLPPTPIHHHHQQPPDHHGNVGGCDEADSGPKGPSAVVHLGVSSLGPSATLHAPLGTLYRAVSEESLLERKTQGEGPAEGHTGDPYSSTTLPRGRHVRRENRHKKTKSACITTLSALGYHEEDQLSHSAITDEHKAKKQSEGAPDSREEKHSKQTKTANLNKYDTLTKQQLVHLVQQQESILSDNLKQIKELEEYIETLLVRVMVESPHLLDHNYPLRL